MQHGGLKALADKVLERNTAARHAYDTISNGVLQSGDAPAQHFCEPPEPMPEPFEPAPQCPGPELCAGCYSIGVIDGRERFIHPPKASMDWEDWLRRWQPKGNVQ